MALDFSAFASALGRIRTPQGRGAFGALRDLINALDVRLLAREAYPAMPYSGTVTWSGSGATLAATVSGVAATDKVLATIRVKPSQAAYLVRAVPSTNTITFELSAANTSNDAQISYLVLR